MHIGRWIVEKGEGNKGTREWTVKKAMAAAMTHRRISANLDLIFLQAIWVTVGFLQAWHLCYTTALAFMACRCCHGCCC